jgi:MFS family permease
MLVKSNMTDSSFTSEWGGWRYPFWISILLVVVSIYIRLKMSESPLYSKLKKEGKTSLNPLKESFGNKANFKMVLLALFGAVMGQGVVWYTGQFYAQSFLENTVKIEFMQNREIMLWGIGLATPFFLVFGALSDRIGRKWIMLSGMLLGVIFYRPIFNTFLKDTNIIEWKQMEGNANPKIMNKEILKIDSLSIDNALATVTHSKIKWQSQQGAGFTETRADTILNVGVILGVTKEDSKPVFTDKKLSSPMKWKFIFLVFVMILFVTMAYAPIAAFLVELFPTRIRYTSMSLPYHIGNGVFGGLVPFIATLLSASSPTDPLVGLWYPILIAALCVVIGTFYLSNKIGKNIND